MVGAVRRTFIAIVRGAARVLTVVGTLALDTLAHVQRLAAPEETGGVRHLSVDVPGGTAGNVAMALARLGAAPRVLAGVGPDFGRSAYERALREAGVDLSLLVHATDATSRAYVFFDGHGGQMTYFFSGASRAVANARGPLRGRVHFAAGEISAYPRLMQEADWVSFDPGQEVFHRDHKEILACVEHVDLLFLNRHERARLEQTGLRVDVLARAGTVVVETRGAEGTIVHAQDGDVAVPAAPAEARDPTGAGDAHRAGFLLALDRGASWRDAARFANVMGAFAVEGIGPQANLPTLAQAAERYQKAYGERPPFA